MNGNPTAYPPPAGHQQMPYGAGFDPSAPRPNSFPYPQQHQQPSLQYPQPPNAYPPQAGYPPRSQPQYFQQQQHLNQPGNPQSSTPNGRGGPVNQPGAFQGLEGQSYSAPPYSQPTNANSGPSPVSQAIPTSFSGPTNTPQQSQQSTANMAAPPQMMNQSTPTPQPKPPMPNGAYPAQNQSQNPTPGQGFAAPLSPKSATREKLRVSLLLEINSHLLQEIISLQQQGKAGLPGQPSPTQEASAASPTSAVDPQSPADPTKSAVKQQPSVECADCMRRLQANLSYLAAVADRHKRTAASFPASPAIMTPPSHLQSVRELYKKLNMVFPGALQALAKQNAMSQAQTQGGGQINPQHPAP